MVRDGRMPREADRRRGGRQAIVKLEDHKANRIPQNRSSQFGEIAKNRKEIKMKRKALALPRGIEPLFQP